MNPADGPRWEKTGIRLLALDRDTGARSDHRVGDLQSLLRAGDLLILNDAATVPASLPARVRGEPAELRLAAHRGGTRWRAVLFGAGDWRTRTEHRPAPPAVLPGERIEVGSRLVALVTAVSDQSPRLLDIVFAGSETSLWRELYAIGRPVQYAHLREDLDLWAVQTAYAARPWAVEMPSAGRPLSWSVLLELRRCGVEIASLTHAAGLSATGDPALDALLPFPERYEIPPATVRAIQLAKARGGRVIAVGTTVVRALEGSAASNGALVAGSGMTSLVIDETSRLAIVDGLISGMHDPSESHFRLLNAFIDRGALLDAWQHAIESGYLSHEFGDLTFVARRPLTSPTTSTPP